MTTHQGSAATSITSPSFSTHQANEVLLAFAASDSPPSGIAFTSVTGANLSWSLRARANSQPGTAEIWQAVAPGTLTNVTVTATRPSPEAGALTVLALSGADTTTNGATVASSSLSSAPSVALTTTAAGSRVWAVGNDWDNASPRIVGAGQTLVDQYLAAVNDTYWVQGLSSPAPSSGTTVTINDTAPTTDMWDMAAIEVRPAASGGTQPPTAPTNLTANVVSPTEVDLQWAASASAIGIAHYKVVRNLTTIASPTATSYADTTAAASTSYTYTVNAVDTQGTVGPPSNAVTVTTPAGSPSSVGHWATPLPWPIVSIHAMLTYTGKILTMQGDFSQGGTQYLWDPATNANVGVPNAASDLFCAGQAVLADGRIAILGGTSTSGGLGTANVNAFNPATEAWDVLANMNHPRWYATGTTLADGRVLVTSGFNTAAGDIVAVPEVYDPASKVWTDLLGASKSIPVYPFMYQLPDGRVLHAGASEQATATEVLDVNRQTWTTIDPRIIDGASIANYAPGKFMKAGSAADSGNSGASSNTAFTLDMSQPSPAWQPTAPMQYPRSFVNLTNLPDGTVLATGGETDKSGYVDSNGVLPAELWNPATGTWTTLAAMSVPRVYHSDAILLPDGRVWVGGGGGDPGVSNQKSSEVFSPPYLFKGPRPSISSAPASAQYGATAFVGTPDAASIARVSLIRTGSDTHSFDQNARMLSLTFSQASGGINVQMPPDGNYAPPGYYMLFLVNSQGVPSIASMIHLTATTTPVLSVTPRSLSFTATKDGPNPAPQTVSVTNAGGGMLSFGTSGNPAWLGVSPAIGTAPTGVTFAPDVIGLGAGTYNATVTIDGGSAQASPQTVAVTLTVSSAPPAGTVLLGDSAVEAGHDSNAAGQAEAFRTVAANPGTLNSLNVYLDAASRASSVVAGIYADNSGHPGTLLARGSLTAPSAGAWNAVTVPTTSIAAGTTYWVAILSPSGTDTLAFRDNLGGGRSETSSQKALTTLPSTWSTGTVYPDGPLSATGTT